jgi:ferredoxin
MKIVVNFDRCKSKAVCMRIAPEVFEVRADGFLYILDEAPSGANAEAARKAQKGCPTKAISIEG